MRPLYFFIQLPNVTSLPRYGPLYYTDDNSYTGNPITIRESEGGDIQIVTPFRREGFRVNSFNLAAGVNSYEPGSCTISFDDSDRFWRIVVSNATIYNSYAWIYTLEKDFEIYEDRAIATLRIRNFSFPSPNRFELELTDDFSDRNTNSMPQMTYDGTYQFPTLAQSCVGTYINIGFGNFSNLGIANSQKGLGLGCRADAIINGVQCHIFCTFSPALADININKIWVDGVLKDTPGLWEVHQMTAYWPSGEEGRFVYVRWNANPVLISEITFEANYYNYSSVKMLFLLLSISSSFAGMDDLSPKNVYFQNEMIKRDIDISDTSSNLRVVYQEKKTFQDILNDFTQSVGLARWRVNRYGSIELITVVPGNITVDYTLGQPDIFEMKIKSNYEDIENLIVYEYGYIPQSGVSLFPGSTFSGWNRKRSQEIYGIRQTATNQLLRWVYTENVAFQVAKYEAIEHCYPRIEIKAVLNEETVDPRLLPGDVIKAKHPDDLGAGEYYRYYWIESLERDFTDGVILCEMIDITHIAIMDYARKLSLQPMWLGQKFYNNAIANINPGKKDLVNGGTDKMVVSQDFTALTGYSWRTNDQVNSDARLFWATVNTDFGNILSYSQYCVSFRVKMTNITVDQDFFCISALSAARLWVLRFNAADKSFRFLASWDGIQTTMTSITANSLNDITMWHHLVFQKRGNSLECYMDGFLVASGTNTRADLYKFDTYIGIRYVGSPSAYSKPYLGDMEEFHVWLDANPFEANGSTCIQQIKPCTWWGINNKWPGYTVPE